MKDWWTNLDTREKQALVIGGFFTLLFLLYQMIWAPLSNHNTLLREQIIRNQKLLTWMQEADTRINATQKTLHQSSTTQSTTLLSVLQKEINQSTLKDNLTQMSQSENNTVQLTFQKVNFDKLITWLTTLWQKQNISVNQITAKPNGTPGDVDVIIYLKM